MSKTKRNQPVQSVRIWLWWHGSPVRITLKPDVPVELSTGGPTEEGWSYENESYEWDSFSGRVECSLGSGGSDCDGRHSYHWDGSWEIGGETREMMDHEHNPPKPLGIFTPQWERESSGQRDHSAEAAGY